MALVSNLAAIWEVPLGMVSFLFSRGVKWALTFISRYYNPTDAQAKPEWQVVSTDFLKSPLKLLWTMSRARWNLHSLIAIGGPFTVGKSLTLDTKSLWQSAPSWTAVVYTLKGYKTIASVGSLMTSPDQPSVTLDLPSGRYLVGLRHYNWQNPVELPAIAVDGIPALAAQSLAAPADFNQFYRQLRERRGLLYSCLNYYVYPLLRWLTWLPESMVKPIFLPVPNPETHFFYGALDRGETLTIELPTGLLDTHRLYFSLYSRDCFPMDWYPITTDHHVSDSMPEQAVYILRVHPKTPAAMAIPEPAIQFTRRRL